MGAQAPITAWWHARTLPEEPRSSQTDSLQGRSQHSPWPPGNRQVPSMTCSAAYRWRLFDGQSGISVLIADEDFIRRVDASEISFSKGDILICEVLIRQVQGPTGLKTTYVVERVLEHKQAARQLAIRFD
jgi:hypothetical protein